MLNISLSFLDPKRKYAAEVYRDGDDAHFVHAPFSLVREQRNVTSTDRLRLRLAAGGGEAIRFVAKGRR